MSNRFTSVVIVKNMTTEKPLIQTGTMSIQETTVRIKLFFSEHLRGIGGRAAARRRPRAFRARRTSASIAVDGCLTLTLAVLVSLALPFSSWPGLTAAAFDSPSAPIERAGGDRAPCAPASQEESFGRHADGPPGAVPAPERCHRSPETAPSATRLTPRELARLARRVRSVMSGDLGLTIRHEVQVNLAEDGALTARVADGESVRVETGVIGKFRREGGRYSVFVVAHLPPPKAVRVLAHEFGHAYYEENYRRFGSRLQREGFAEWVAYRVLESLGRHREALSLEGRDDLYGRGLRLMLAAEQRGGLQEVLRVAMY